MSEITALDLDHTDAKLIRHLARNIAIDIQPIETILANAGIDAEKFETLRATALFQNMLSEEAQNWSSAPNVGERVRLKYLTIVEEAAPDMFHSLVDAKNPLSHRSDLLKTMAKLAGLGESKTNAAGSDAGGRIKITINMGAERSVQVEHQREPVSIDGEVIL